MNIRIGNDVRVLIPISSFGNIDATNIKFMTCTFERQGEIIDPSVDPFQIFQEMSAYTIHGCDLPVYNVLPSNVKGNKLYADPRDHGSVVYGGRRNFITPCVISDNNIVAIFPAEVLHLTGSYNCHFDIKVYEPGWDIDNLHSYRCSYYDAIDIVDTTSGHTGSITITPDNVSSVDTYIFLATEDELNAINGNYSSIIASVTGFELTGLDNGLKDITITGSQKHIVLISKYDSLSVMYNSFQFPMNVYNIGNGYYLYVSTYTYSDYSVKLTIIDTKVSNTVIETNPYVNNSSSSSSSSSSSNKNPTHPSTDTSTSSTLTNANLSIEGSYSSNNISVNGLINNYTLLI